MFKVVAERLVTSLKNSGFVVMRKPIEGGRGPGSMPEVVHIRQRMNCDDDDG